jgi:hypothetical protein
MKKKVIGRVVTRPITFFPPIVLPQRLVAGFEPILGASDPCDLK